MAQRIRQLGRYERQVDLHQEEGDNPTRHTEVGEETPPSNTVEGTGFERRRQFRKTFSSYEHFVASCSSGVIFFRQYLMGLGFCITISLFNLSCFRFMVDAGISSVLSTYMYAYRSVTYMRETRELPDAVLYLVTTRKARRVGETSRPIAY